MKLAALIKKEFHRFFHDPRLIVTILLPGVIIFLLYTLLGTVMGSEERTYEFKVYLSGSSEVTAGIEEAATAGGSTLAWLSAEQPDEAISAVERGDASAYLVFSEHFDEAETGGWVDLYYSSEDDGAGEAFFAIANTVLQVYGMRFTVRVHSFLTEEDFGRILMQNLLPMLVVIFIFSACMSVTLESVAGEKERGTLATILATSVNRAHIALGKIIPLSCVAALGAASSFFGVFFSLPKLMGLPLGSLTASYGAGGYVLLLLVILGIVPLIVSAIAAVSAYAKSVKEASAYTSILMIAMIVLSIVSAYLGNLGTWAAVLPILNVVVVMQEILSGGIPVLNAFLCFGSNLIYTALLVLLVAKMLSSERVMFGK